MDQAQLIGIYLGVGGAGRSGPVDLHQGQYRYLRTQRGGDHLG